MASDVSILLNKCPGNIAVLNIFRAAIYNTFCWSPASPHGLAVDQKNVFYIIYSAGTVGRVCLLERVIAALNQGFLFVILYRSFLNTLCNLESRLAILNLSLILGS